MGESNGGTFSIGERVGRLAERQESLSSDIMEVRVTLAHLQEHLSTQDAKLDDLLKVVTVTNRLAGTLAELERRVRNNEVRMVTYASVEEHRRDRMKRMEERQDNVLLAVAAGAQSLTNRLFWPLVIVAAGVFYNALHAGVWDHVSIEAIAGSVAFAALSWLLNMLANRRLKARTLAARTTTPAGERNDGTPIVVDVPAMSHTQDQPGGTVAPDEGGEQ